jgi:hypothetical protein
MSVTTVLCFGNNHGNVTPFQYIQCRLGVTFQTVPPKRQQCHLPTFCMKLDTSTILFFSFCKLRCSTAFSRRSNVTTSESMKSLVPVPLYCGGMMIVPNWTPSNVPRACQHCKRRRRASWFQGPAGCRSRWRWAIERRALDHHHACLSMSANVAR